MANLLVCGKQYLYQPGVGHVELTADLLKSILGIDYISGAISNSGDELAIDIGSNLQLVAKYNDGTSVTLAVRTKTGTQTIDLRMVTIYDNNSVWSDFGEGIVVTTAGYNYSYNTHGDTSETQVTMLRLEDGSTWSVDSFISGNGARVSLRAERW